MNNLNKFEFDFNLGSNFSSNQSKPLKDQKPQSQTSSYSSFSASRPTTTPNKPAWTHQPLPTGLPNQPTSMVGDISGKSWNSIPPSNNNSSLGIGIIPKNPNLFGDLLGSSLGSNKTSNSNAPLKSAAPLGTQNGFKNTFSMGSMGNSLPRTGSGSGSTPVGNLGGAAMKTGGLGPGTGAAKKDPFGSLVDFSSKKEVNLKGSNSGGSGDYSFGDFQNAGKSSTPSVKSPPTYTSNIGSNANTKMDDFGDFEIPIQSTSSQKPATGGDSFDMFFSSSSAAPAAASGAGGVPFSDMDDWNMDSEYAGDEAGSTTELDGLPPPPAGVNVSIAKNKGMDSYKQGQHPDAIKWLTWAVVLLEKAGDSDNAVEVLSCRASCYKEVGEYKKAIADCTKVLEQDGENVAVLTQRALLYESSEKYRLGADDLRTVLKIDPGNRLARSTIHRLNKMAE